MKTLWIVSFLVIESRGVFRVFLYTMIIVTILREFCSILKR
jgi:hypothetical protein